MAAVARRVRWWRGVEEEGADSFPWPPLGGLLGQDWGKGRVEIMRNFLLSDGTSVGVDRRRTDASPAALRQRVAGDAGRTLSLHTVPDPRHYLVFDCDFREQRRPTDFDICRGQRHDARAICIGCWRWARAAALILDAQVAQPFQISRAPLHVFSGGNGLHVWFRLDETPAAARLFSEAPARRVLFNTWLTRDAIAANALLVAALTLLFTEDERRPGGVAPNAVDAFGVQFDEGVTCGVANPAHGGSGHMIRLPFSLHDRTGTVALPLPLLRAGQPATLRHPEAVIATSSARDTDWLLPAVTLAEGRTEMDRFLGLPTSTSSSSSPMSE